ncbi:MAG: transglutaminase family protein [Methanothrix sp.]
MTKCSIFLLSSVIILSGLALAEDIPYVFDGTFSDATGYTTTQLESMRDASPYLANVPAVSTPRDDEILEFPVTGGGNAPGSKTEKKVIDLKRIFDSRVEPENPIVRDEAVGLVARYPGDYTIDQISSIYTYLKEDWHYIRDPRGVDYYMYANETLKVGEKANCIGAGDCDDFAILMSALVESVGGTTRIVLARNNSTGGHAFAEVYLGRMDAKNSHVTEVIDWLKKQFHTDKIYSHVDTDTKDVWLNLDWGADEKGNAHPGGPFYLGDKYMVLCIRDQYGNTQLNVPENALSVASSPQRKSAEDAASQFSLAANALPFSPASVSPGDAIPPGAGPIDWYVNKN